VTGALLVAALALVVWPGRRSIGRRRVAAVAGGVRVGRLAELPVPPVVAAVGGAVGVVAGTPLVGLLAGLVGYLGARTWLAARRDEQVEQQVHALADGLAALSAELRAGRPLADASDAAARACGDVSGPGLLRALRAPHMTTAGDGPVPEALARIAAGVRLSSRTGCSLAVVAAAVEDDLRSRRRHRDELRAAVAAPRASALVLAGLPVLGIAMGSGIGADPWTVLTTTGVGQVLLVAGVGLELAGLAWSGRLVRRAVR
jgi:tight adherence protein B